MSSLTLASYFLGGGFLVNAIPHFVAGVQGKAFQSPFASPPGVGLSRSVTNVLWGFTNMVAGYFLVARLGSFDHTDNTQLASFGSGALIMGLMLANYFGKFHGGNKAEEEKDKKQ